MGICHHGAMPSTDTPSESDAQRPPERTGRRRAFVRVGLGVLVVAVIAGAWAVHDESRREEAAAARRAKHRRAVAQTKAGRALLAQGNPTAALEVFQSSRSILERLPEDSETLRDEILRDEILRDLADACESIGDAYVAQGDFARAAAAYRECAGLLSRSTIEVDRPDGREDRARVYERLCGLPLETGEEAAVLATARKLVALREALADEHLYGWARHRDLFRALIVLGNLQLSAGALDDADASFRSASVVNTQLRTAHPEDGPIWRDTFVVEGRHASVLFARGKIPEATEAFERLVADVNRPPATDDPAWALERGRLHVGLAEALLRVRRFRAATAHYRTSLALREQLESLMTPREEQERLRDRARLRQLEFLGRERAPWTPADLLALAYVHRELGDHAACARFLGIALEDESVRADVVGGHLFNAARVEILSADGALGPQERAARRERALAYLDEDLRRRRDAIQEARTRGAPARELGALESAYARHVENVRAGERDLAALRDDPRFAKLLATAGS